MWPNHPQDITELCLPKVGQKFSSHRHFFTKCPISWDKIFPQKVGQNFPGAICFQPTSLSPIHCIVMPSCPPPSRRGRGAGSGTMCVRPAAHKAARFSRDSLLCLRACPRDPSPDVPLLLLLAKWFFLILPSSLFWFSQPCLG